MGISHLKMVENSSKNSKFRAAEIVKMAHYDILKSAKIDFTQNQSVKKIAKFPHCDTGFSLTFEFGYNSKTLLDTIEVSRYNCHLRKLFYASCS